MSLGVRLRDDKTSFGRYRYVVVKQVFHAGLTALRSRLDGGPDVINFQTGHLRTERTEVPYEFFRDPDLPVLAFEEYLVAPRTRLDIQIFFDKLQTFFKGIEKCGIFSFRIELYDQCIRIGSCQFLGVTKVFRPSVFFSFSASISASFLSSNSPALILYIFSCFFLFVEISM